MILPKKKGNINGNRVLKSGSTCKRNIQTNYYFSRKIISYTLRKINKYNQLETQSHFLFSSSILELSTNYY